MGCSVIFLLARRLLGLLRLGPSPDQEPYWPPFASMRYVRAPGRSALKV
jgi:hypothetical protein